MTDLDGLPASQRISRGLRDLKEGEVTVDALVVAIASRRLGGLGLPIPPREELPRDPELALYELLCARLEDPFFAYRAVLDELDSFVSSLEATRAWT
jgi:hypothetical protein